MEKDKPIGLSLLRPLIDQAAKAGITELHYKSDSFRLHMKLDPGLANSAPPRQNEPVQLFEDENKYHSIKAPLKGIFYRRPKQNEPPYVSEEDVITEGQVIGTIETMKVFNEIIADHSGKVVRFAAKDKELVEAGSPLLFIDTGMEATPTEAPRY